MLGKMERKLRLLSYSSIFQTICFSAQKNRLILIETVLFKYQQHMLFLRNKKNFSVTHSYLEVCVSYFVYITFSGDTKSLKLIA